MNIALSVAWYSIQFLRLALSTMIILLGFLLITKKAFWVNTEHYPMHEKLIWIALFCFGILALIACNKLVTAIKKLKEKTIFIQQNTFAFKFAAWLTLVYLVGKYALLLFIHTNEQNTLAWSEWWNDSATQISEVISFGLLACFFWVIAKLIEEGIVYKNENDLTI